MMVEYTYDGTYEGFLTVLKAIKEDAVIPQNIVTDELYQPGLFSRTRQIKTHRQQAAAYFIELRRSLTDLSLRRIFAVFVSEAHGKEMCIWRYIDFGKKVGRMLDAYLTYERVRIVHEIARKVGWEAHRMRGLLRFRELENKWLYAPIRTDHYVLPFIGRYFCRRLAQKQWIIHDRTRKKVALYDGKTYRIADVVSCGQPAFSQEELGYQELWRTYFKQIAIAERTNLKLQRHFLPKKYREFLTEMEENKHIP
jgi:probable DNA metabolism protein